MHASSATHRKGEEGAASEQFDSFNQFPNLNRVLSSSRVGARSSSKSPLRGSESGAQNISASLQFPLRVASSKQFLSFKERGGDHYSSKTEEAKRVRESDASVVVMEPDEVEQTGEREEQIPQYRVSLNELNVKAAPLP